MHLCKEATKAFKIVEIADNITWWMVSVPSAFKYNYLSVHFSED